MVDRIKSVESIYLSYDAIGAAHATDMSQYPSNSTEKDGDDAAFYFQYMKPITVGDRFGYMWNYQIVAELASNLSHGTTSHADVTIISGDDFDPTGGHVMIGAELIQFTGTVGSPTTQLTGLTRGDGIYNYNTSHVSHSSGDAVRSVFEGIVDAIEYETDRGIYNVYTRAFVVSTGSQASGLIRDMYSISEDYVVMSKYTGRLEA